MSENPYQAPGTTINKQRINPSARLLKTRNISGLVFLVSIGGAFLWGKFSPPILHENPSPEEIRKMKFVLIVFGGIILLGTISGVMALFTTIACAFRKK